MAVAVQIAQPGGAGVQTAACVVSLGTLIYPTLTGQTANNTNTHVWSLTVVPSGSIAAMVSANNAAPAFTADLEGNYTMQDVVSGTDAGTYTFTVTAQNQAKPASPSLLYGWEPTPPDQTGSTVVSMGTGTSNVASFFPFQLPGYVRADYLQLALSMSFSTLGNSSGQQTHSLSYGIYSRGAGANSTTISQILGSLLTIGVTGNNSTYSINQPVSTSTSGWSTAQTSSGGSNITSGYTGGKLVLFPINSTLSPGNYLLGLWGGMSTSSIIVGLSNSLIGYNNGPSTLGTLAPIGSFSSGFSTGAPLVAGFGGNWNFGMGSHTVANLASLPSTLALSLITGDMAAIAPLMKFVASR